jgi:hypothetical protein
MMKKKCADCGKGKGGGPVGEGAETETESIEGYVLVIREGAQVTG